MHKEDNEDKDETIRQQEEGIAETVIADTEETEKPVTATEEQVQPETIVDVPSQAEEQEAKISDLQNRLLRLQADFDNFRRRTVKEQTELSAFVTCEVVAKFLRVLDSFERAEVSVAKTSDLDGIRTGLEMIKKQLQQALQELAVEEIPAQGEKFNPVFHEAIMRGTNPEAEDDTVDEVLEKGYKLRDKVIRHSKVRVVHNS